MDRPLTPGSDLRRWVDTWRAAGEALGRLKRDELERLDTVQALEQLADAFRKALREASPTTTSGLVEQQRIFARLRA
jgi:hypothetical protein